MAVDMGADPQRLRQICSTSQSSIRCSVIAVRGSVSATRKSTVAQARAIIEATLELRGRA